MSRIFPKKWELLALQRLLERDRFEWFLSFDSKDGEETAICPFT